MKIVTLATGYAIRSGAGDYLADKNTKRRVVAASWAEAERLLEETGTDNRVDNRRARRARRAAKFAI